MDMFTLLPLVQFTEVREGRMEIGGDLPPDRRLGGNTSHTPAGLILSQINSWVNIV